MLQLALLLSITLVFGCLEGLWEEKKAEEWKKLEHVAFISSPMSGKPVKVVVLLCPAQCDFEELFLSLQHWVIKMGGGESLLHPPISALLFNAFFSPQFVS